MECASLRRHHAILSVVGQGASSLSVSEDALVNAFATRDLHLSECIAAAHLAAGGGGGGGGGGQRSVLVHGIDVEDDSFLTALDADDFWTEADQAAFQQRLLGAVEPQLRTAVNTWLQGIPKGTSSSVPRQRFVLSRLESALSRTQAEAFRAAFETWRASHPEPRVREQSGLRASQSAHLLARLRDLASGRLGGRRCGTVLAVVGCGHAARIRQLAAAAAGEERGKGAQAMGAARLAGSGAAGGR
ncbi:hypothetical protein GPECTOR_20g552 [Gonium pectorale]|uniref:Uncharacterized protein n=1 Tax=Gonium pectorale TaxID=33097 RepID=A0A150GJ10_GONPE|nr:hypothetical protein GPECTOR_20g552 [Gonium pectorale]|eukprot:KXZ49695.1 hypothetical protein GPECTOR_20g552 [Gonium pectorale]